MMNEHIDRIECRADELMLNEELRLRVLEWLRLLHQAYFCWRSIEATVDEKRRNILEGGHHAFCLVEAVVQGDDKNAEYCLKRVAREMGYELQRKKLKPQK